MLKQLKSLKPYVITYIGLIFLYMVLMLAVYSIPNSMVEDNVKLSLDFLELEGTGPLYTFYTNAARTDNYSDAIIYQEVLREDNASILYSAMDNQDYARYWHGHSLYMRPLSIFFDIRQVRYLLMIAFYALAAVTLYHIQRRFGLKIAVPFLAGFLMIYPNTVSTCLQLTAIFLVTLSFTTIILKTGDGHPERIGLLLFLSGSVANFFDLLTIPMLSFGIPLIFALLMNKGSVRDKILLMIRTGIAWVTGYGGTWAAKWVIGTIVLKRNVISDALSTAIYRIDGKEDWFDINYPDMFRYNITNILPPFSMACNLILLGLLAAAAVIFAIQSQKARERMKELWPLLLVAASPYAWYTVLLNHSCIHSFFTYRLQMITVVALGICFSEILCAFLKERKEKLPQV